jgi:hypothetical protein
MGNDVVIDVPKTPVKRTFKEGAVSSQKRLKQLGFDPIRKLVQQYNKLEKEIEYWELAREHSEVVELDKEGKEKKRKRYSYIAHMACYVQMEKIGSQLMRYMYGRVPETVNINENRTKSLVIEMSNGDSKVVNPPKNPDTHEAEWVEIEDE